MNPKIIIKGAVIIGCFGGGWFFANAAQWEVPAQDENTLNATAQSIQQEKPTVFATKQKHPAAPMFALLALGCNVSGGVVLVWVLGRNLGIWIPREQSEQNSQENQGIGVSSLPPVLQQNLQNNSIQSQAVQSLQQYPITTNNQQHHSMTQAPLTINVPAMSVGGKANNDITFFNSIVHMPYRDRLQYLWDFLLSDYSWIMQMLKATPIIIWGEQRCGKTEKAKFIALLRYLFLGWPIEVLSPHAHKPTENWDAFPVTYGHFDDFKAIDKRILAYQERLKKSAIAPLVTIWDEYTQYSKKSKETYSDTFDLIQSLLSESKKSQEYAILVSHGITQEYLGGTKGTCQAIDAGFVRLRVLGELDALGDTVPTGRGFLTGLTKNAKGRAETIEVKIPIWMQAQTLLRLFPEIDASSSKPQKDLVPAKPTLPENNSDPNAAYWLAANGFGQENSPKIPLEKSQDSVVNLEDYQQKQQNLTEQQKTILKFARKQQKAISARDVMRIQYAVLADYSADDIREVFKELEKLNFGCCRGEGQSLTFVLKQRGQRA